MVTDVKEKPKLKLKIDGKTYTSHQSSLTGQEILSLVGKNHKTHIVYLLLEDGDMEEIRAAESVDLNRAGIEKFMTFETDVIYRLEVNGHSREWGADHITGKAIKRLSGLENDNLYVWQKKHGQPDHPIGDRESVSLYGHGIEVFTVQRAFTICIEGESYSWPKETIMAREIAQLGGWDISEGVVEIDNDQNEHTLQPDQIIHLRAGIKFCKKQRFRRGLTEESRIGQELGLLQQNFPKVQHQEVDGNHWFMVEDYKLSPPLSPSVIPVVFSVTSGHPVVVPYGFFVPTGIKFNDIPLTLTAPPNPPPFSGNWLFVSWTHDNWIPAADINTGSNLWAWVRSFKTRLAEGE